MKNFRWATTNAAILVSMFKGLQAGKVGPLSWVLSSVFLPCRSHSCSVSASLTCCMIDMGMAAGLVLLFELHTYRMGPSLFSQDGQASLFGPCKCKPPSLLTRSHIYCLTPRLLTLEEDVFFYEGTNTSHMHAGILTEVCPEYGTVQYGFPASYPMSPRSAWNGPWPPPNAHRLSRLSTLPSFPSFLSTPSPP